MNRTRRLLFSVFLVTLLVATLAVPLVANAGKYGRQWGFMWVFPHRTQTLWVGEASVTVPAGALPYGGPVLALVQSNRREIQADFWPDYSFQKDAILSLGDVNPIYYVDGRELVEVQGGWEFGGRYYYPIDHFSRYSGWF